MNLNLLNNMKELKRLYDEVKDKVDRFRLIFKFLIMIRSLVPPTTLPPSLFQPLFKELKVWRKWDQFMSKRKMMLAVITITDWMVIFLPMVLAATTAVDHMDAEKEIMSGVFRHFYDDDFIDVYCKCCIRLENQWMVASYRRVNR